MTLFRLNKIRITIYVLLLLAVALGAIGVFYLRWCSESSCFMFQLSSPSLDEELQIVITDNGLEPADLGPEQDPAKVILGEALFFDKELSGNRDISCATCHHPLLHGGDGLPLSFGTGGRGLGTTRALGEGRALIPRNAPEIFNRGAPQWRTMFWDGRVAQESDYFGSPAADFLPQGLDNVLAVQAMFPSTSRDEMRGRAGDQSRSAQDPLAQTSNSTEVTFVSATNDNQVLNELALITDGDLTAIWSALTERLLLFPEYRALFQEAYPQIAEEDLGFQHVTNAIAAYEIAAFSFLDSPWDRYLAGNQESLTEEAKRGALLFYGEAGCGNCHSSVLMTDQEFHNIGVPQLGPGKGESGFDFSRFLETEDPQDMFAFRTPPLRNVALTGPWMHNGTFSTLEEAVRHHLNAAESLVSYSGDNLPGSVRETLLIDTTILAEILSTLDPLMEDQRVLSPEEFNQLMAFLQAQTSPSAVDLSQLVPESVPSGLPVWD